MRFEFEHITVEVKDSTEGDERTFVVTLKAPATHFQMTNHLQRCGVIEPLDSELKQSARDATTSYLRDAESLLGLREICGSHVLPCLKVFDVDHRSLAWRRVLNRPAAKEK